MHHDCTLLLLNLFDMPS